jgi:hypothetical protein
MPEVVYRDLGTNGVPLVTPSHDAFAVRLRSIRDSCWFPVPEIQDGESAAILVNLTDQTILAFAAIWRYFDDAGETHTSRLCTLGSSRQIDALRGRSGVAPDDNTFVLPGSQRLITEQSVYGDNHDVVPPEVKMGSSYAGSGRSRSAGLREPNRMELSLDVVILDDGCVLGPDATGLMQGLVSTFAQQRQMAGEMVAALRRGATPGVLFDMLRPLAEPPMRRPPDGLFPVRNMFVRHAVEILLHQPEAAIFAWAEREAEQSRLQLHRAVT